MCFYLRTERGRAAKCLFVAVSWPEPEFLKFYGAQESILRKEFRQPIGSLAGRYNNPIPPRYLALIDCLKIPAQLMCDRDGALYSVHATLYGKNVSTYHTTIPPPGPWNET